MPTLKQIRDDLGEIRHYYKNKESFDKAFELVTVNEVFNKVNKYNDAMSAAPLRLFEIYIKLYVDGKTQFTLSEEYSYTPDYIRQLNRKLLAYLQRAFGTVSCSGKPPGEGGEQ